MDYDRSIALQALAYPEAVLKPAQLSACGVSSRRAFPAGVSLPSVPFDLV
ncbi:hypothetical protein [Peribacillus muralis]